MKNHKQHHINILIQSLDRNPVTKLLLYMRSHNLSSFHLHILLSLMSYVLANIMIIIKWLLMCLQVPQKNVINLYKNTNTCTSKTFKHTCKRVRRLLLWLSIDVSILSATSLSPYPYILPTPSGGSAMVVYPYVAQYPRRPCITPSIHYIINIEDKPSLLVKKHNIFNITTLNLQLKYFCLTERANVRFAFHTNI